MGMKIPLLLSMGGNDCLPKYYSIPHKKMITAFVENSNFRKKSFSI